MIEKPPISDEKIISALRENYSLSIVGVEFLPIGNDASASAYRVNTENQNAYFLKIRKEISNQAGFLIPRFLQAHGVEQALAPFSTKNQELWIRIEDFFLVLYPFVIGEEAMKVGMSDSEWIEFGSTLKQIHDTKLPADISQYVRRETFVPKWSNLSKELQKLVGSRVFNDPYRKHLSTFWRENHETVQILIERAEIIGKHLQQTDLEFVLCHADIHTANILLTQGQEMFIVDWDDSLLAPKERDLMFVRSEDTILSREAKLFFEGYGNVTINQLALAYYRYEWCVQEIGDFGERVFLTKNLGEISRQDAVEGFIKLFSKGDVIEAAFNTPFELELRNNS